MKNRILLLTLLGLAVIIGTSCYTNILGIIKGSGKLGTIERTVPAFTGVEIASSANVYLRQGPVQSVKIEGDDNIIQNITTEVKKGVLVIDCKKGSYNTKLELRVYITVPDLKSAIVSGSGDIKTEAPFTVSNISLNIEGWANIIMELNAKSINTKIAGSGNIDLSGNCNEHISELSGSGEIQASKLQSQRTDIKLSGSGNCKVDAANELLVDISGSGNVLYKGDPGKLHTSVTGSGDVRQMN